MMKYLRLVAIFCPFLSAVQCGNILGVFPLNGKSHFMVVEPLLEELANRGHNVDVMSHFPRQTPLKRYSDLSLNGTVTFIENIDLNWIKSRTVYGILYDIFDSWGKRICDGVVNSTVAKDLLKSTKKYDLIITELFFTDCMLGYVQLFNAPVIGVIASVNLPWTSHIIGVPDNPSYIPNYFAPYVSKMSFGERFYNGITLIAAKLWHKYYAMEISNRYYQNFFGVTTQLEDLIKNFSLVMVNSHFSIHQSRPFPANLIEIAGIHIKRSSKIPEQIETILNNSRGVIYLSFGTVFTSEYFPEEILRTLFEGLKGSPHTIIWKGNREKVPKHLTVPDNIVFIPWAPQVEILCHHNTKLFISHAGLLGTQDAMYCAKPTLAIPVWADQLMNANIITTKGIGLKIPCFELTKGKLTESIDQLLNNESFKTQAKFMSNLFRDRSMNPLATAVYWTEYILKYRDVSHLRSTGSDLPWFSYYCVDIIGIPIVLIIFSIKILSVIYHKIKRSFGDKIKVE